MTRGRVTRAAVLALLTILAMTGCQWQGANSLPLPGTAGGGPGSYTIQAQLPDVDNIERNSRVRVGDVTVGTVTKIERQGWHALVTMTLDPNVSLPANATASIGQTSLLGSKHIELSPPENVAPEGKLGPGSLIPLSSGRAYPTTEKTLAALSVLLNGGGLGQLQDITAALSTAFAGREQDLRSLIQQLDTFIGYVKSQTDDIIDATNASMTSPALSPTRSPSSTRRSRPSRQALGVLSDERQTLADALTALGRFSALAADSVNRTKESLVAELRALGPVLESLGSAGPSLTRSLSILATFPWPNETLENWVRGDYANLTAVIDLTLSRIDQSFFTGTRWEGNLTELELQWGRTIGQMPSPATGANPLVVPYHFDQGP